MSDLTATQCGCSTSNCGNSGCGSFLWIIILLYLCGGCGNNNGGFGGSFDGCGCESIILILLLLSCCGGNSCGCN